LFETIKIEILKVRLKAKKSKSFLFDIKNALKEVKAIRECKLKPLSISDLLSE
jgi:hypothetical protein